RGHPGRSRRNNWSFRGAAAGREPGLHKPGAAEYGFRARSLRSRPGMTENMETLVPDSRARVEAAMKAFARGELVVVTDDDDRENEGDLFVAASLCTPEKMAFIIRHTSGIVCA